MHAEASTGLLESTGLPPPLSVVGTPLSAIGMPESVEGLPPLSAIGMPASWLVMASWTGGGSLAPDSCPASVSSCVASALVKALPQAVKDRRAMIAAFMQTRFREWVECSDDMGNE